MTNTKLDITFIQNRKKITPNYKFYKAYKHHRYKNNPEK